jgi:hypothetical protein
MTKSSAGKTSADAAEKHAMRRSMYDKQVEGNGFKPGPRAKYDPNKMQEQVKCKHPFESLRWGANKTSVYASCTKCGLKTCILYHLAKEDAESHEDSAASSSGIFMTSDEKVNAVFEVKLQRGMVMADTGCRRAVGGSEWHQELQEELDNLGISYRPKNATELFQFGPGEPIPSIRRWIYPVGINGQTETLEIAEVDAAVPGLIGPDEMAAWGVKLDFTNGTVTTNGGVSQLHPSQSGHPCIGLLDYDYTQLSHAYQSSVEPDVVSDSSGMDPEILPMVDASSSDEGQTFQLTRWDDLDDDDSSEESTHAHSSDEEVDDLETESESADEVGTIFEVCPTEREKFMTKGDRRHQIQHQGAEELGRADIAGTAQLCA